MPPATYDLYFTGSKGNPRQCIVIGEDVEPVFYRFETPDVYMTNTRTTVSASALLRVCTPPPFHPFPFTPHQLTTPLLTFPLGRSVAIRERLPRLTGPPHNT